MHPIWITIAAIIPAGLNVLSPWSHMIQTDLPHYRDSYRDEPAVPDREVVRPRPTPAPHSPGRNV